MQKAVHGLLMDTYTCFAYRQICIYISCKAKSFHCQIFPITQTKHRSLSICGHICGHTCKKITSTFCCFVFHHDQKNKITNPQKKTRVYRYGGIDKVYYIYTAHIIIYVYIYIYIYIYNIYILHTDIRVDISDVNRDWRNDTPKKKTGVCRHVVTVENESPSQSLCVPPLPSNGVTDSFM